MLIGELLFYKDEDVIKTMGDEDFSEYNPEQLSKFVKTIAARIGATKAVSDCVYHGGADGSIKTVLFLADDSEA